MADAADRIMKGMLAGIIREDATGREAIRAEIDQNGTVWAAEEIDRLRRRVESLQRRVTESEGRGH